MKDGVIVKKQKRHEVRSVTKKTKTVLFEKTAMQLRSQRPLPSVRRCWSSQFKRWWTRRRLIGKWRAEEEERHKGSLTIKIPSSLK
jgi:hypothetical protein